jgi:hypothetical protein
MSIPNLTPDNITKVKTLVEIANINDPTTTEWDDAERTIKDLLLSFWLQTDPPKDVRLAYYNSGIFDLVISVIKAEAGTHSFGVLHAAWLLINTTMTCADPNMTDSIETLQKGIELGFLELAIRELRFRPLRHNGSLVKTAFIAITNPSNFSYFTNHVISSGAPVACLELIRQGGNVEHATTRRNLTDAIISLNNLARFNANSVIHILPDAVDVVKPYLPLLTHIGNDDVVVLGFFAAGLLIRLYGKDDTSNVISENPLILEFYVQFMRDVMDVGPTHNYELYNLCWTLADITFDLSLISMCDANKQLLVPIVPLAVEMMALHHNGDRDGLHYGIMFLSQVSFDESCLVELKRNRERVKIIQDIILSDKDQDKETLSLLSVVMNAVFPLLTFSATASSSKQGIIVMAGSSVNSTSQVQVMISYDQKSTSQHAQVLGRLLKKHNYKVWDDYENHMKGDVMEAMVEAVQMCGVVVVLVSIGYKESANCRMECQYAMKRNKPLLFLICDEKFHMSTGWLSAMMRQQEKWVEFFTPAMVEGKADKVMRRLGEILQS